MLPDECEPELELSREDIEPREPEEELEPDLDEIRDPEEDDDEELLLGE
jgi:hypothetical protein